MLSAADWNRLLKIRFAINWKHKLNGHQRRVNNTQNIVSSIMKFINEISENWSINSMKRGSEKQWRNAESKIKTNLVEKRSEMENWEKRVPKREELRLFELFHKDFFCSFTFLQISDFLASKGSWGILSSGGTHIGLQ